MDSKLRTALEVLVEKSERVYDLSQRDTDVWNEWKRAIDAAREALAPADTSPAVDIYSHPDCTFNYCPHPQDCRPGGQCVLKHEVPSGAGDPPLPREE